MPYTTDLTTGKTAIGSAGLTNLGNIIDDNTGSTNSASAGIVANTDYIGVDFGSGNDQAIQKVTILFTIAGYSPKAIDIQRSDNGSAWTTAASISPADTTAQQAFTFASSGAHRYWRLLCTDINYAGPGNGLACNEIEMMAFIPDPSFLVMF